ncbi:extracellular solute-binding protein [Tistrella bauzanensis]|uniref:extracellular solute-binding protein n=1 Tax=Tistrella TaxID=171436 RepID=UPI0031F602B4
MAERGDTTAIDGAGTGTDGRRRRSGHAARRLMTAAAVMIGLTGGLIGGLTALPGRLHAAPSHGVSMYGDLKYPPDFTHFAYAYPDAPKGGTLKTAARGTFDSLNPFALRGISAGVGSTFDTLTVQSLDEPFSEYGLIARTIDIAPDNSSVTFTLRRQARFHDGSPVTAADVAFTFDTLKTKGHPMYRIYYAEVEAAEVIDDHTVRFSFSNTSNRELPLILGQLPVLSKAFFETRDFTATTLEPLLGSGPYKVASADPGRSLVLERVKDYWARDLPVNVGRHNFDRQVVDYYRDDEVSVEAFKAGQYDLRLENSARRWATAYNMPEVESGKLQLAVIPHRISVGMQGLVMNTRRPKFQDPALRRAMQYVFDFEWSNKTLFYGAYTRTDSYFENSSMASSGVPEGAELALLEPFRDQLPEALFTEPYAVPRTDGSGSNREGLKAAYEILQDAGYEVRNGKLYAPDAKEPLRIEFLIDDAATERIVMPITRSLGRLGIDANVRMVDAAQYENRLQTFDYDIITEVWAQSQSPGNEQREYWGSDAADRPGSRNYAGIKNPVVDALIQKIIDARDRSSLVTAVKALDRVLLWGDYVIPNFHLPAFRLVYWNKFGRPQVLPDYGIDLDTWWVDQALARKYNLGR